MHFIGFTKEGVSSIHFARRRVRIAKCLQISKVVVVETKGMEGINDGMRRDRTGREQKGREGTESERMGGAGSEEKGEGRKGKKERGKGREGTVRERMGR